MPHALTRVCVAMSSVALFCLAAPAAQAKVLRGTQKADRLVGSAAADKITARGGRDVVKGAGGADILNGGAAADRITADGLDTVVGGPGNDKITLTVTDLDFSVDCGAGKDELTLITSPGLQRSALLKRVKNCERVRLQAAPVPAPDADPVP